MNSFAQNILYIYLFVFIAMSIFDIACIFFRKANEKRLLKKEEKINKLIKKEDLKSLSSSHIKYLSFHLKNTGTFIAFTNVIKEMDDNDRKIYLTQLKSVFFKILPTYKKIELIRKTYFVSILADYPYIYDDSYNSIIHYLIGCCASSSVFLREYALLALYRVGNENYIKEALEKMNFLRINHHPKLLTDGFMKFTGNEEKFVDMLEKLMPSLEENYKVACINYFHYKKIPCQEYVYHLLTSNKETKEVCIACLRYFGSVKFLPAKKVMFDYLHSDKNNWEFAAISASSLRNYPGANTLKNLLDSVKSHNWYVRNNSAATIIQLASKQELEEILKIDDRYAVDALNYQLNLKRKEV